MPKRPHRRTLADHLATWDAARLAALLELRPDLGAPPPVSIDELAQRAQMRRSIDQALAHLRRPELSLVEILASMPRDVRRDALGAVLPDGVELADVEPLLDRLDQLGLAWRSQDRLHWPGALTEAVPTGLGPPLRELLEAQPVDYVRHAIAGVRAAAAEVATAVPPAARAGQPSARPAELVDELESLLTTPGLVDAVLEVVSPDAADLARLLGLRGGYLQLGFDLVFARHGRTWDAGRPERELFDLGLLLPVRYDGVAFVPREAGVSLRGGRPVAELDLEPPAVEPSVADTAALDASAGAAAALVLHQLADLLARLEQQPAKVLKAGGIGVTAMKGVAAALDVSIEDANRLVELLAIAGLLHHKTRTTGKGRSATTDTVVIPAPAAEAWLSRSPTVQWRQLATAWLRAEHWPSDSGRRDEADSPNVLLRQHAWGAATRRRFVLDGLAAVPAGHTAPRDQVVRRIGDDHPWSWRQLAQPFVTIGRTLDEAVLLGVAATPAAGPGSSTDTGGVALSTFGRALLDGDAEDAEAALEACLPAAGTTFLLQADLTVTVVGALERSVLTELRLLADVESTGAATTLRLSEASVRRALDAGRSAEDITAFLEAHAAKGVPKPVSFLVGDAARRHGHLQVGSARTFVTGTDPAVLADACSHRRTRKLKLRLLAPTVAVSPLTAGVVLEGLRDAGFAPVPDGDDPAGIDLGPSFVDHVWGGPPPAGAPGELPEPYRQRPPVSTSSHRPATLPAGPPPSADELAATLLAAPRVNPVTAATAAARRGTTGGLGSDGTPADEVARAVATGRAVAIDHIDDAGRMRSTLLVDVVLDEPVVSGLDLRRGDHVDIDLGAIVRAVALAVGERGGDR